ncbi:MAG: hemerythrin domain-containing protein [Chroococcidiopsidaceae cyanobacterium CP_BM_ER_R8_30]|nr:hemerythrin domain-containing protein [Chroococcidiopsidaceae cyanobacterium CP_BM_ER_R8_30]
MLSNFNHTTRRRFCTLLGTSALLGIATENLASVAQTNAPATDTDAISILVDDHRRIEALMNQIAQTPASDPTQRSQLLQQLIDLLTVHNFSEENLVYPAIRDIANLPGDATTLYQEQDQTKVLVFELNQLPKSDPDWGNLFTTFQNALLSHVAQEENVDFPRLRTAVGPKLSVLTTQMLQLRSHWS